MRELTMGQAVREAVAEEMHRDERVVMIGEPVGEKGLGTSTPGIAEEFGDLRVRETGIIETVIGGGAVGAALAGLRPIADFMNWNFAVVAYDEVTAKGGLWRYEHGGGDVKIPVVFRGSFGGYGGAGTEHSRALTATWWHAPGLKIAIPTTPYDAKGLMKTAIRDDNPVVFMTHSMMSRSTGEVPEEEYLIPFGEAKIRREGADCTIVAVGYEVPLSLQAADALAKDGISVEVIDPRTLTPLDIEAIEKSVRKTGRLVVVDEDFQCCGVGAEIGFRIQERAFDALKSPVQRVDNPNIPHPVSRVLVNAVLPTPDKIVAAVKKTLNYNK